MYGLAVNLIMSVSGHSSIINEISGDENEMRLFIEIDTFCKWFSQD